MNSSPVSPPSKKALPIVPWRAQSFWSLHFWALAVSVLSLLLFGVGEAMIILSTLGNSPWSVFAQGLAKLTPLSIGMASLVTSLVILLLWLPLRIRFGLNSLLNAIFIALGIDLGMWLLPCVKHLANQLIFCLVGVVMVGVTSAFYLSANMGTGPRDGIMVELSLRFGWKIAWVRTGLEIFACLSGWLMGGTLGLGTIFFALTVGHVLAMTLRLFKRYWD